MKKKQIQGFGLVAVSLALVLVLIGAVSYVVLLSDEVFNFKSNPQEIEPQPPTPAIPPYPDEQALTEEEKSEAIELAINDPEVKKWLDERYEIYKVISLSAENESGGMCMVYIPTQKQRLPWVLGITLGVPVDLVSWEAQGGCINFELELAPLTEEQEEEVVRIALANPKVLEMIGDKEYVIQDVRVDYWESSSEGKCSFHAYPCVGINVNPGRIPGILANVFVDLENKKVVEINSIPRKPISRKHIPSLPPSKENLYEIPLISSFKQIDLYENGEVESLNELGGIAGVLVSTLSKLNLQATCVFSEEDIQKIKSNDKVIEAIFVKPRDITISQFVEPEERYHIPVDERGYRILGNVKTALFILEDNLDEGLEAHILIGSEGSENRADEKCSWEITQEDMEELGPCEAEVGYYFDVDKGRCMAVSGCEFDSEIVPFKTELQCQATCVGQFIEAQKIPMGWSCWAIQQEGSNELDKSGINEIRFKGG